MASELLDIQPRELKFLFELKKLSSCTVRLVNNVNDYVAFKVKTTSPKKYCVRPNVGIIKPKSFYDFIVTMQAPKVEPPDMICKDKFLVQSTVVPASTTDDDLTSSMFAGDDGRYVERVKLRVILLSPPNSPTLSPINPILKQDPLREAAILKDNVIPKRGSFTQNNQISDAVVETNVGNSKVVKPTNITTKEAWDLQDLAKYADYTRKELEDPLKYFEHKPVKGSDDLEKNGNYKTVDHLQDKEHPTKKEMGDSAKYADYATKELDDPFKYFEHKPINSDKDPEENESYKTTDYLQDKKDPAKNGDCNSLDYVKDEEYTKEDKDYDTLDHVIIERNPEKYYKILNNVKDEVDPTKGVEYDALKTKKHLEQSITDVDKTMGEVKQTTKADVEVAVRDLHQNTVKDMDEKKLVKDVDEMKSKLNFLESKLTEAEVTISKLTEERKWTGREREILRQELAMLRSKPVDKKVQVGYPFLFVCMVAVFSIVLGYTLRC